MTCNCDEKHSEQFTCTGCGICVLGEKQFFANPDSLEEKYCLKCAVKKAELTPQDLLGLLVDIEKK